MNLTYEVLQTLKIEFIKHLIHKDKKHVYILEMKEYINHYNKTKTINKLIEPLKILFLEWVARNNENHPDIDFLEQFITAHKTNRIGMTPELYFTSVKEFKPEVLEFLKLLKDI